MNRYERTQRSFLLHWIMVPLLVVVLGGVVLEGAPPWAWLLIAVYLVALSWVTVTFSMLTVLVGAEQIRVYFGRGWPRKAISRADIVSVRAVRNEWWHGLGIRWIRHGALWNVWGRDAAELQLRSGRVFRVGTDDVDALVAALLL
ncbi:MAG: hypothetical protein WD652_03080 [Acidimicrobiia bacterium]